MLPVTATAPRFFQRIGSTMRKPVLLLSPNMRKIRKFQPKAHVRLETRRFTVKTVENGSELAAVLRLRHDVFYRELLGKRKIFQLDVDRFDFFCDHLVIIDNRTEDMVGTYRLNASTFSNRFYTESEFHFDDIRNLPGHKLELGRACVKDGFRNGITLTLMWKGLLSYMEQTGCRYLFGCSSIKTMDTDTIRNIHHHMLANHHIPELDHVKPRKAFRVPDLHKPRHTVHENPSELIPPLLQFYLKCGAQVCGEPALDKAFKCIDYLTILDKEQMDAGAKRKYGS